MPWTWRYEKADGSAIATDDLQEAMVVLRKADVEVPLQFDNFRD